MSYRDFIKKYVGKYANPDPYVPNQCVDLVNCYIKEVWGLRPIQGNAKDFDKNYNPKTMVYIKNSPTFVPKTGDIAVFWIKPYGHVDIVYSDRTHTQTRRTFWSFSQNWPLFSRSRVVQHYAYFGVKGFLRKK